MKPIVTRLGILHFWIFGATIPQRSSASGGPIHGLLRASIGQVVLKLGQSWEASQELARVVYVAWLILFFLRICVLSFGFFFGISVTWIVHEE